MNYSLFPYQTSEVKLDIDITPENLLWINAPLFWGKSKGEGALGAVIDTGIDISHPEFQGRIVQPANFTQEGGYNDVSDRDGHGTHVSGTACGTTKGVAPLAKVMPIKVFGAADGFQFQEAFRYILDYNKQAHEKDRVLAINCSWGGPYDPVLHYLIRELIEGGTAVFGAAGNQGDGNPDTAECFTWPGFLQEVVTVGALDLTGKPAGFSSSYEGIDLAAPGTNVLSAWPGGGYKNLSGTSMACPHVFGAYLNICSAFRDREGRWPTEEEGVSILFKHIKQVDVDDRLVGRGLLDLSWQNTRWPLYRVQMGAYYSKTNADQAAERIKQSGFSTYVVKY